MPTWQRAAGPAARPTFLGAVTGWARQEAAEGWAGPLDPTVREHAGRASLPSKVPQ